MQLFLIKLLLSGESVEGNVGPHKNALSLPELPQRRPTVVLKTNEDKRGMVQELKNAVQTFFLMQDAECLIDETFHC